MDRRVVFTLNYAKEEIEEIAELCDEGKLSEKDAFIRMFCLGKVLVGWDDEGTILQQMNYLIEADKLVNSLLDEATGQERHRRWRYIQKTYTHLNDHTE